MGCKNSVLIFLEKYFEITFKANLLFSACCKQIAAIISLKWYIYINFIFRSDEMLLRNFWIKYDCYTGKLLKLFNFILIALILKLNYLRMLCTMFFLRLFEKKSKCCWVCNVNKKTFPYYELYLAKLSMKLTDLRFSCLE